jgi:hypothetical protein
VPAGPDGPFRLPALEAVLVQCLGRLPGYGSTTVPPITFDDGGTDLVDLGAVAVAPDQRPLVSRQVATAFRWCARRFPMSGAPGPEPIARPAVTQLVIGTSGHPDELLSASSRHRPGTLFMAAAWPLPSTFRFASLIAHEAVHQWLFAREAEASPVRPGSIGYSPWKKTHRPGGLVWHAFWTFTCQLALLGGAVLADAAPAVLDPGLPALLADLRARSLTCVYSLELFGVLVPGELARCRAAAALVEDLVLALTTAGVLAADLLEAACDTTFSEFEAWANRLDRDAG